MMASTQKLLQDAYRSRRVLVTGHTGFKGGWLALWLHHLGARVTGYSLAPPTQPSLFEVVRLNDLVEHHVGDIRDFKGLAQVLEIAAPDFVFHLAAQPIVRRAYEEPLETLTTNVIGTAHVLEVVRQLNRPCVVVVVTSDKCYQNQESTRGYRETDPMGGKDPYSVSKGCAELVTACWRDGYGLGGVGIRVASARAGNVIGGGDWARDRILPDCMAALSRGEPVPVRNPHATRPWQHVLESLSGYLLLGAKMGSGKGERYCGAWNFGPDNQSVKRVRDLVEEVIRCWGNGEWVDTSDSSQPYEATLLALCCDKAVHELGWQPAWDFTRTVAETVRWYKTWKEGRENLRQLCLQQIEEYSRST